MQAYKICRDLFQQFIITCFETVPDTTELRTRDVLDSSFDFHQRFPCHVYALELEHPSNSARLFNFLWVSESMRKPICLSFSIMPPVWYLKYKISSSK